MPSEILAIGTSAASSNDQVVSAGTPLTVCLKDASGPAVGDLAFVDILLKADNGEYFVVDTLTGFKPALMIVAPGTYRFARRAGVSCGVFSG
jgi:hypothetical protein